VSTPVTGGFEHECFFYGSEPEFVSGVAGFVRDGLVRDETVVVAEPRRRLELLREVLADDAAAVTFHDMAEIGANPARIIGVWATALAATIAAGRTLRGVGEPAYAGRREAELAECELHEQLLNHAFTDGPAWRLLCPYDRQNLPDEVCRRALGTHPLVGGAHGRTAVEGWTGDWESLFAAPLPPPSSPVLRGGFGPRDVPAVRRTVRQYARSCGLATDRVEALELAVSELATNSIRHGGGSGSLAMWVEDGAAVVEVSDAGHLADPLTGRREPPPAEHGGRGLYLVNQLADLVQLRSAPTGTTVRVTSWL
jgi:anti-sigma regulatory factor (Ser/Thr protein kinase)